MTIQEIKHVTNGKELVLRSPRPEDAEALLRYIQTVPGESRFLRLEKDETDKQYTLDGELKWIEKNNNSPTDLAVLAFVDGRHAGNATLSGPAKAGRRLAHRASMGIALYREFTGMGIGGLMLDALFDAAREHGYEQIELTVVKENERARCLYEKKGFVEFGCIPNALKYADGTYADLVEYCKRL